MNTISGFLGASSLYFGMKKSEKGKEKEKTPSPPSSSDSGSRRALSPPNPSSSQPLQLPPAPTHTSQGGVIGPNIEGSEATRFFKNLLASPLRLRRRLSVDSMRALEARMRHKNNTDSLEELTNVVNEVRTEGAQKIIRLMPVPGSLDYLRATPPKDSNDYKPEHVNDYLMEKARQQSYLSSPHNPLIPKHINQSSSSTPSTLAVPSASSSSTAAGAGGGAMMLSRIPTKTLTQELIKRNNSQVRNPFSNPTTSSTNSSVSTSSKIAEWMSQSKLSDRDSFSGESGTSSDESGNGSTTNSFRSSNSFLSSISKPAISKNSGSEEISDNMSYGDSAYKRKFTTTESGQRQYNGISIDTDTENKLKSLDEGIRKKAQAKVGQRRYRQTHPDSIKSDNRERERKRAQKLMDDSEATSADYSWIVREAKKRGKTVEEAAPEIATSSEWKQRQLKRDKKKNIRVSKTNTGEVKKLTLPFTLPSQTTYNPGYYRKDDDNNDDKGGGGLPGHVDAIPVSW